VTLSFLVEHQERYDGTRVKTRGRIRAFNDPRGARYFVLEDADHNRVEIDPALVASRYVGSVVEVTGCFTASASMGRAMGICDIVRIGRGTPRHWHIAGRRACHPAGPVA